MFHKIMILIVLALLLLTPVAAQDSRPLAFNEPLTDEMTTVQYQFTYTFTGKAGDIILVEFYTEILNDLDNSRLILESPNGRPLAENDGYHNNRVFAELISDGEYTVIVTRPTGADGSDVGEFSIGLYLVQELEIGSVINETVTSADSERFYVYRGINSFYLAYNRDAGEFTPEVTVNTIGRFGDDGQLKPLGSLTGELLDFGNIGTFFGDDTYIIRVGRQLFSSSFDDTSATFTLEVLDAEKL